MSTQQGKLMGILGVVILICTILSLLISAGAMGAKQELKIALATLGNEIPVHFQEQPLGNDYLSLLYDPLVGINVTDGTLSKETGAARDWTMSPDGKTWTFYIRKGIKFHDGTELTAKDVKFSIELNMRPESKGTFGPTLRDLILSIEIPEPYTLVLNTKTPNLGIPGGLSDTIGVDGFILPKDYYERVGFDRFRANPIGSGPCKWVEQSVGSYIKLETIDKHWRNGVPKYKYVTLLLIPEESTRIAMLKSGGADVIDISRERVAEIKKAGFNVHAKKGAYVVGLYPHGQWQNNPLADKRVRKALAISINRQEIAKSIFSGMAGVHCNYPIGSVSLTGAGDPTLKPWPYDPEEAKRLLREVGYSETNPLVQSMAVYPRAGLPEGPRMMEAIAGYWEKLGMVKVNITQTEYAAWRKRRLSQDNGGWVSWAHVPQWADMYQTLTQCYYIYHSAFWGTQTKRPDMDALIDKATHALDPKEARKALEEVHRLSHSDYLMFGVVEADGMMATSKAITKWVQGKRGWDNNIRDLIAQ